MYVVEALLRIIAGYFEQGFFGAFEIGEAGTTRDRRALRLMFADLGFADTQLVAISEPGITANKGRFIGNAAEKRSGRNLIPRFKL